ncbi:MAG TPA: glucohydrolase, partial [Lactobacillus acetotolerans]|nr:glucohydrolase [Lactobacillus acetotolerans]
LAQGYSKDELIHAINVKSIDEVEDIESINMYKERLAQGYSKDELIHAINVKGRDNARTPMQWSDDAEAGFTTGMPWLHVNPNYVDINVKNALADHNSIFYTYQKLIKLRHENDIVVNGDFELVSTDDNVLAYYRVLGNERWLVVANLSSKQERFTSTDEIQRILISNYDLPETLLGMTLKPYEAFAVAVKK